jgi:hypothetical protein
LLFFLFRQRTKAKKRDWENDGKRDSRYCQKDGPESRQNEESGPGSIDPDDRGEHPLFVLIATKPIEPVLTANKKAEFCGRQLGFFVSIFNS